MENRYRLLEALRPFSLAVALVSCALGVLLAWQDGYPSPWLAAWVMIGGVLAQAGVNLINDVEELPYLAGDESARRAIRRNQRWGIACFAAATLVGLWLVTLRGWPMLVILLLAAFGALAYTMEPFHLKRRGLAAVAVFLLMGLLMIQGAYLAMSGRFSLHALLLSVPVSLLISLLLVSNELRDWEEDRERGVGTLTVRIGYDNGRKLYWALVIAAYAVSLAFYGAGELRGVLWLLPPLLVLIPIRGQLWARERGRLTPLTGRFFLLFGLGYLLSLA